MIIRELPADERPREKMISMGRERLSSSELLAILLRTGTRDKTALALAEEVLGFEGGGLKSLAERTPEELASINGIGRAKACQIMAAVELGARIAAAPKMERIRITGTKDAVDVCMERMRYYKKEFFNVLLINAKGELMAMENVSVGDIRSSIVNPREAFNSAVRKSALAVVFVHNHPSGDPTPSREDRDVTKRLCEAGDILGIKVLDHIIIGDGDFTSFRELDMI